MIWHELLRTPCICNTVTEEIITYLLLWILGIWILIIKVCSDRGSNLVYTRERDPDSHQSTCSYLSKQSQVYPTLYCEGWLVWYGNIYIWKTISSTLDKLKTVNRKVCCERKYQKFIHGKLSQGRSYVKNTFVWITLETTFKPNHLSNKANQNQLNFEKQNQQNGSRFYPAVW